MHFSSVNLILTKPTLNVHLEASNYKIIIFRIS